MGFWRLRYTVPALYLALLVTSAVLLIGHDRFARGADPAILPTSIAPGTELGNTFEAFGCANWSWGRYPGQQFAIAMPATRGGDLTSVWVCWKTAKGYGAGTFGRWRFALHADAPGHVPAAEALATVDGLTNPPDGYWEIPFKRRVPLIAGATYHLTMANTDPNPKENWSSPNTVMSMPGAAGQGEPLRSSADGTSWSAWGSLSHRLCPGRGGRAAYLLHYSDESGEGMPYYSASFRTIWGTHREGQTFTWPGPETHVREVGFPVCAVGVPPGPLTFTLEEVGEAGATVLATGVVATSESAAPQVPLWKRTRLAGTAPTLRTGGAYRLWLGASACDADNGYGVFVPYSSDKVPGWTSLTWGGAAGCHTFSVDGTWLPSPVPADLTFSMLAE